MLQIVWIAGTAFVLQFVLSSYQMKHFNREFMKLRKQGQVVVGRKSGGFHAGAIVMFRIDENGLILESKKLEGTTFLARVKDLSGFEGIYVHDVTKDMIPKSHRNLRKAVEDAAGTYKKFMAGEDIVNPPSPFQKIGNVFKRS